MINVSQSLDDLIRAATTTAGQHPWPRAVVMRETWNHAIDRLVAGYLTLLGLWGERDAVHMALYDAATERFAVLTHDCASGSYPSVGQRHPPAIRLERALYDLFGIHPSGLEDIRPWLDHGRWAVSHPLGERLAVRKATTAPFAFLETEGEHLHRIPVGPVHAGIIEPGHFRFTAGGETVVRMEERLGYTHKGVEGLMAGSTIERAARLAGRVSGDSTVAYAYAFARAVESARGIEPPPRAVWLRALMAELERLANHFGDIGAICNDASFALMHAHCGILREQVLRAADACFGHRMMRDRVVPGGIACDLGHNGAATLSALIGEIWQTFPSLIALYDDTTSLQDRTIGTGHLRTALAQRFGAGGFVGRASGRAFDARRLPGYEPYDRLQFEVPVLNEGDVNARVWIRIREVEQSLALLEQLLRNIPVGAIVEPVPAGGGEGIALIEGFRGDILVWLRLGDDGAIERCHLRDPSWFQWPLLEAALEGNIVADFPLCNKSFNCSYSGHDL